MSTLTKYDLAKQLKSGLRWDLNQGQMVDIIETLTDLIVCHFQNSEGEIIKDVKVSLRGFGTFKLRRRKAYVGRSLKTGEPVDVAESYSLGFKPAAEVCRRLNNK